MWTRDGNMGKVTLDYCRKLIIFSKRTLRGEIRFKTNESILLIHRILPIIRKMSRLTLAKKDVLKMDKLLHTPLSKKEDENKTGPRPHDILKQIQYDMMYSNGKPVCRSKVESNSLTDFSC